MAVPVAQQAQIDATGGAFTAAGPTDLSSQVGLRLRVVIVTPERAVLDEKADFVVLPMIDGELGVLPQHAPLIGRIGNGELRITKGSATSKWQIVGGFAQIRKDVVTVLTEKASAA